jgi:hypothetical protein
MGKLFYLIRPLKRSYDLQNAEKRTYLEKNTQLRPNTIKLYELFSFTITNYSNFYRNIINKVVNPQVKMTIYYCNVYACICIFIESTLYKFSMTCILTCDNEMAKIPKSDQSQNTSRKYKSEK